MSKGEKFIENILIQEGYQYEKEKQFKDMKYKGNLRCDFYIEKYHCGIEIDGEQHLSSPEF